MLALLIGAIYFPSLSGEFLNDDTTLIARNTDLQSLSRLPELLGRPMWSGLAGFEGAEQVGHWRPLTSLTLALGFALGAGPDAPFGFHLLSLLLHLLATFAAWRVARRLLGSYVSATAVALLFALHPLHVESVAWISSINDPLFGALSLFSIDAWLAWRARASRGLPLFAAGFLFAALLSKELALATLPMLLVCDRMCRPTDSRAATRRGWVLLLGTVGLWFGLRMWVFGDLAAGFGRTNADYGSGLAEWRVRAEILGGGVWHLLVPIGLSPLEPFREVWPKSSPDFFVKLVGLGLFFVALLVGVRGLRANKAPAQTDATGLRPGSLLAFTALGILAALSPALAGIRGLGQTPFADRYLYLAVFFVAVFLVASLSRLLRALGSAPAIAAPIIALTGLYAGLTLQRIPLWHSPVDFYRAVTERHPDSPAGFWNLGEVQRAAYIESLNASGRGDLTLLEAANANYERASQLLVRAQIDPTIPKDELDYLRTGVGQAWYYLLIAEVDAYADFDTPQRVLEMLLEQVMKREAANAAAGGQRGRLPVEEVFTTLGVVKLRAGDEAGAADEFRRALDFHPNYGPALHNLGAVRFHAGQYALSSKLLGDALALSPGEPALLELLAQSLFEEGWVERSLEVAAELERVAPSNATPEVLRGLDALRTRNLEGALGHFDRAIDRDPRAGVALFQRGMTLYQMGQADEAIKALRRACEADPTNFTAHYNLASLLFDRGAPETAQPYLERAYSVGKGRSELPAVRKTLLQLDPDNAPRLRALADLDDRRGDTEGALFWTERALAADPDNGRSRHLMGRLLLDAKEPILALPELVRATELLPNGYQPFLDLARCQAQLGRYPGAREAYGRARELVEAQEGPVGPNIDAEALAGFQLLKNQQLAEIDARLAELP